MYGQIDDLRSENCQYCNIYGQLMEDGGKPFDFVRIARKKKSIQTICQMFYTSKILKSNQNKSCHYISFIQKKSNFATSTEQLCISLKSITFINIFIRINFTKSFTCLNKKKSNKRFFASSTSMEISDR